jgi:hypothetical protein
MNKNNKISDLRDHLFNALDRLGDDSKMANPEKMAAEIDRAKAISEVAQVVVNSLKEEIQFINAVGRYGANGVGISFIEGKQGSEPTPREIGPGQSEQ